MCLQPQDASADDGVDTDLFPPACLVTGAMHLTMMTTAERDSELIADLPTESRRLCKTKMMRISRMPAANQAWLLGDRFHMFPVAYPAEHRQRQDRFVDTRCPISSSAAFSQRFGLFRDCRLVRH